MTTQYRKDSCLVAVVYCATIPFICRFFVVIPLQRALVCKEQFQRKFVFAKDISDMAMDLANYYANAYAMHGLQQFCI